MNYLVSRQSQIYSLVLILLFSNSAIAAKKGTYYCSVSPSGTCPDGCKSRIRRDYSDFAGKDAYYRMLIRRECENRGCDKKDPATGICCVCKHDYCRFCG